MNENNIAIPSDSKKTTKYHDSCSKRSVTIALRVRVWAKEWWMIFGGFPKYEGRPRQVRNKNSIETNDKMSKKRVKQFNWQTSKLKRHICLVNFYSWY